MGGIIYVYSDRFSYQQYLQTKHPKIKCLYISYEFLELLDWVGVFIVTSQYECLKGADVVFIGHALVDYSIRRFESIWEMLCV